MTISGHIISHVCDKAVTHPSHAVEYAYFSIFAFHVSFVWQIQNRATFVIVDKLLNPKDGSSALLIQGIHFFMGLFCSSDTEVCCSSGCTTVNMRLIVSIILLDNGGGMDPEAMRCCLSFGFSDKKSESAIGQCMEIK